MTLGSAWVLICGRRQSYHRCQLWSLAEEEGQKGEQGNLRAFVKGVMGCALWRCWPLERKLSKKGHEMKLQMRPKWLITMKGILMRQPKLRVL